MDLSIRKAQALHRLLGLGFFSLGFQLGSLSAGGFPSYQNKQGGGLGFAEASSDTPGTYNLQSMQVPAQVSKALSHSKKQFKIHVTTPVRDMRSLIHSPYSNYQLLLYKGPTRIPYFPRG